MRASRLAVCAVALAALAVAVKAAAPTPFSYGQEFTIQCKDPVTGAWSHGPICHETGKEIVFRFGEDQFTRCGWHLAHNATFRFAERVIRQEEAWQCRVPMSADGAKAFYIPFPLPLWGVVEATHLHLNYHMNIAFHADLRSGPGARAAAHGAGGAHAHGATGGTGATGGPGSSGQIIGAAAYPVRDKFQYGAPGSVISLHAPVRWFDAHSYRPLSALAELSHAHAHVGGGALVATTTLVLYCLLTATLSAVAFTALYHLKLRPELIKHLLKKD